jgi:hypothetical protein
MTRRAPKAARGRRPTPAPARAPPPPARSQHAHVERRRVGAQPAPRAHGGVVAQHLLHLGGLRGAGQERAKERKLGQEVGCLVGWCGYSPQPTGSSAAPPSSATLRHRKAPADGELTWVR